MAEEVISGDTVLNDSRKDLAKDVKMDLARCPERQSKGSSKRGKNGSRTFYLGAAWRFDSELFETMVLQADVVLDCGATETAGGVEAVQILVDAVTQGFSLFSR